jgi:hypothetical protein
MSEEGNYIRVGTRRLKKFSNQKVSGEYNKDNTHGNCPISIPKSGSLPVILIVLEKTKGDYVLYSGNNIIKPR